MQSNSENPRIAHIRDIFYWTNQNVGLKFSKDKPLKVALVRNASGSDESGYFIFFAGGVNTEECFYPKARITAGQGVFDPGIYLLHNEIGGAVLLPTHKIDPSELENANFRSGQKQEDELFSISASFEDFFRNHFHGF